MSYLEYNVKSVPSGWRKLLHFHWGLFLVICAIAAVGFVVLYSVAGGSVKPWAEAQAQRFTLGVAMMLFVAFTPIWFWRNMAGAAYAVSILLLLGVELFGDTSKGATRWIDLGFMRLQPSEIAKITVVMALAAYYDAVDPKRVSRPLYLLAPLGLIFLPMGLVLVQPDLGTALLLALGGGAVMFVAGVHWAYFAAVIAAGGGLVTAVMASRGTAWQLLQDYQYRRIDTFRDPEMDPLGAGYHITQSKIALGSGGWSGRGFMQGTQSQLNFLPEKHTDFIFTVLAEEFGFVGGLSLLLLYALVLTFCILTALRNRDRFAALVTAGVAATFFLYFAINMAMVMGLVPVVGVPLPLVSYGGTSMLVLMIGFGLVQSGHIHRPRLRGE